VNPAPTLSLKEGGLEPISFAESQWAIEKGADVSTGWTIILTQSEAAPFEKASVVANKWSVTVKAGTDTIANTTIAGTTDGKTGESTQKGVVTITIPYASVTKNTTITEITVTVPEPAPDL